MRWIEILETLENKWVQRHKNRILSTMPVTSTNKLRIEIKCKFYIPWMDDNEISKIKHKLKQYSEPSVSRESI